jgi:hypothetical protein
LAAALCAATALAQSRDPLATRGGWELGLQAAGYEYDEPYFATLEGARVGVSASYTMLGPNYLYGRIEARYSYGALDYTGSGTAENEPDHLFETRVVLGVDYRAGRVVWSPFIGVGYRYLYSDVRGLTSTNAIGYRRESRYWYLPIGLTLRVPLGGQWTLVPQIEYDGFTNGKQRSYLSDTGLGFNDVTNHQQTGRGSRAQLYLEGARWSFGLWTNYWKIDDSDVQPVGMGLGALEPGNTTHESGVEVRYRF